MPKGREVQPPVNGEYQDEKTADLQPLDAVAAALNALLWSGTRSQRPDGKRGQHALNIATVAIMEHKGEFYLAFNEHELAPMNRVVSNTAPLVSQQDIPVSMKTSAVIPAIGDQGNASLTKTELETEDYAMFARSNKVVGVHMQDNGGAWVTKIYAAKTKTEMEQSAFNPKLEIPVFLDALFVEDLKVPAARAIQILTPTNIAEQHAEMRLVAWAEARGFTPTFIGVSKPCCDQCAAVLEKKGIGYSRWSQVNARSFKRPDEISNTIPVMIRGG